LGSAARAASLVLGTAAGLALAAEGLVRAGQSLKLLLYQRSLPPVARRCIVPSRDPELLYELNPGWTDGTFTVNSFGMADDPREMEKPPGVFRIAFVGDSVTCGFELLPREDLYWKVLERRWNRAGSSGERIECLGFGVNGYGILQDARVVETRVRPFDPDLVVVQLSLNDPYPSDMPYGIYTPQGLLRSGNLALRLFSPERFRAWFFVERLYDREGRRRLREGFEKLARESRSGPPLLAVLFPHLYRPAYGRRNFARFHGLFREEAERAGLPFLDLLPEFLEAGILHDDLAKDPQHPDARGHRVAAEILERELRSRGLLPGLRGAHPTAEALAGSGTEANGRADPVRFRRSR